MKKPSKTTAAYLAYLANPYRLDNVDGIKRPVCSYGTQESIIKREGWAIEVVNPNNTRSLKLTDAGRAVIS